MMCEKCWSDAFVRAYGRSDTDQPTEYHRLLDERRDRPCTPEEQRGPDGHTTQATVAMAEACNEYADPEEHAMQYRRDV